MLDTLRRRTLASYMYASWTLFANIPHGLIGPSQGSVLGTCSLPIAIFSSAKVTLRADYMNQEPRTCLERFHGYVIRIYIQDLRSHSLACRAARLFYTEWVAEPVYLGWYATWCLCRRRSELQKNTLYIGEQGISIKRNSCLSFR